MEPAPSVGEAFFPLDDELGLLSGGLTPRGEETLARLASWMPYASAQELLQDLLGIQVSLATARRATLATGQAALAVWEEEVAETFLCSGGDITQYFEFNFSPHNVVFDARDRTAAGRFREPVSLENSKSHVMEILCDPQIERRSAAYKHTQICAEGPVNPAEKHVAGINP